MAIYTMADFHLSLGTNKSMEIFKGWSRYMERIQENCMEVLTSADTLVIGGDISWGMHLEDCLEDFRFIENLPGQKVLLKGNHDYFWSTKSKIERFFAENGFSTLSILHNNTIEAEGMAICGTRGWVQDGTEPADQKVIMREVGRLQTSIREAKKTGLPILCFLHYPPVFHGNECEEIMNVLLEEEIEHCYYGHIHGAAQRFITEGMYRGVELKLVSADYLRFIPFLVKE